MEPQTLTADELDAVRGALASAQRMLLAAEEEDLRLRDEMARLSKLTERGAKAPIAAPAPMRPAVAPPVPEAPVRRMLAIVDVDPAWTAGVDGRPVALVAPTDDVVARVASLAASRVLVNLAAPGAFDAMLALRTGGCRVPFSGCIGRAGEEALMLGGVEATRGPIDPDHVLGLVAGSGHKKVLTAGADAERLIGLRRELTRGGMAVSIAWDAKQAETLLEMLIPDLAVIDLALAPRGGHALAVRLGSAIESPPVVVLVGSGEDPAAKFAAVLGENVGRRPRLGRERLLEQLLRKP